MKIYLASRFRTLPAVLALKAKLVAAGHEIVSTWHDTEAQHPIAFDDPNFAVRSHDSAERDIEELLQSDAFIILTEDCEQTPGGLWFEMGVAYITATHVIVFGPRINVFCYLDDDLIHVNNYAECLDALVAFEKSDAEFELALAEGYKLDVATNVV